jgi:pyruvate formate lyase activating enzyme
MKERALMRRQFLKRTLAGLGLGMVSSLGLQGWSGCAVTREQVAPTATLGGKPTATGPLHEARFYRSLDKNVVQCLVCFRRCVIEDGQRSFCRNKENRGGTLYSLVYGKPCTVNITVPEKGPLYHFIPGHQRLALATVSCNLRCTYCQNWQISQRSVEEVDHYDLYPEEVVELALSQGAESVSFTYTEPTAFYEYMVDIARLARVKGLKTSIISNGFINPAPWRELLKVLDAVKIDLKGFSEEFYREVCSAELRPVLTALKTVKDEGVHLEIVNLVVPTLNDDPEGIREMCVWIKENLGGEVPLHFNRFTPNYKLIHLPSTPIEVLDTAKGIAHEVGLKYVYVGNVPGHEASNTNCPTCGERLVQRVYLGVLENNVVGGKCKFCGAEIPGIWE